MLDGPYTLIAALTAAENLLDELCEALPSIEIADSALACLNGSPEVVVVPGWSPAVDAPSAPSASTRPSGQAVAADAFVTHVHTAGNGTPPTPPEARSEELRVRAQAEDAASQAGSAASAVAVAPHVEVVRAVRAAVAGPAEPGPYRRALRNVSLSTLYKSPVTQVRGTGDSDSKRGILPCTSAARLQELSNARQHLLHLLSGTLAAAHQLQLLRVLLCLAGRRACARGQQGLS